MGDTATVWPNGAPTVGARAERSREVEVTDVRADRPITELETRVTRDDGTEVWSGTAVCHTFDVAG